MLLKCKNFSNEFAGLLIYQYILLSFSKAVFYSSFTVADLGGAHPARAPPTDQNFFNFIGFFQNISKKYWVGAPLEIGAPPRKSSGSAPEFSDRFLWQLDSAIRNNKRKRIVH